ncbi:MAG: GGDEF domain-containing protein [Pseudomonadota bacterium]
MSRWGQRLAAILDWSAVDKSLFVVLVLAPILAGYLLGTNLMLALPDREKLVNVAAILQVQTLQICLLAGICAIAALCLLMRRSRPNALWVQHLATQYYTLALVASSYYIGTLTFATGVVLLGAPVFGFILLNRVVVWWAAATGSIALITLTYASTFGWIPYAPSMVPPGDAAARLWWVHTMYLFSFPHALVILLFADQTVGWWRQREETIRELGSTDMLTGLHNRRSIMSLLEKEVARSRRDGQPLSVVLLDLDHFKRINDTWGHPTGDRVLQRSAHVLRESLRQHDAVGRYGGEEFMLLLPGTALDGARILLERCREQVADSIVDADTGEAVRLSASFGLACNEGRSELDAEDLIRLADEALYRAKAGGRNRVEAMQAAVA